MVWFTSGVLFVFSCFLAHKAGKQKESVEVVTYLACVAICILLSVLIMTPHLAPEVCK